MQESNEMTRRQFFGIMGGAAALVGLSLAGCKSGGSSSSTATGSAATGTSSAVALSGSITAVGSTALQPLVEVAASQFMTENPGVQITVQGGGSGQGITQIVQGAVQIGDSDVFAETKLSNVSDISKIADNKVCVVGMGPIVNSDVTIDDISLDDLKGIFTGSITNWKDVGGANEEIVVINRASGSGTRATFESAVLQGAKVPSTFTPQEQDSSGTVAQMVAQTPGSISYLAFSYYSNDFKALSVGGVDPKPENIEDNSWTIWAYEHMYTAVAPDTATAAFIDYMMGDEVQKTLVTDNGYIPVGGMKVSKDKDGKVSKL